MPSTHPDRGPLSGYDVLPIERGGVRFYATYDWTGVVTGQTVQAPPAGTRLFITKVIGSVESACNITLFLGTDTVGNRVARWNPAARGGIDPAYFASWRIGDADVILRISTAAWNASTPVGTVTVDGFSMP